MSESDVTIRPIDMERDADRLATMWNESDLQWPLSWTHGVPFTAAQIREWHQEERNLIIYVAEVDGAIAGYCSFSPTQMEGEAYLELLNVSPRFQKRSIGRRLIQATIDYAVEKGLTRQTLDTWPANFKAVPTYKKTGHFWTPDRGAWMQNYIPGALQMPLAKPFFERHDWYSTYVRELDQEEDDQRWKGLKVFTQHWEADGESLTIWIDREARAPVAVETDALFVAAVVETIEPVGGQEVRLTWQVSNKTVEPLPVFLHATGDKGLSIDHRDAFTVPSGETVERTAMIKVAEDAPRSKDDDTAPVVRSILQLGDAEAELFSGLRTKKPLSLDTDPDVISTFPGKPTEVRLQLHNELPEPCTVTLILTPPDGLALDWTQQELELPAESHVSVPVVVTSKEEQVYDLQARLLDSQGNLKPVDETLTLFSLSAGGMLAHRSPKAVRIETDELRVTATAEGGVIKLEHKGSRKTMATALPRIGPPYYPSDFEKVDFSLELEERAGRAFVRLGAAAKHQPGLYLIQTLAVSPTGLCELRCAIQNRGPKALATRLRFEVSSFGKGREHIAACLPEGLVYSHRQEYPATEHDLPRSPASYAEPWLSWETGDVVAGVGWDDSVADISTDWNNSLTSDDLSVPAGERRDGLALMLYAGTGDWRSLRERALRWAGRSTSDEDGMAKQPATRPHTMARIEPDMIATLADQVEARLIVDTLLHRSTAGTVSIETEPGLVADFKTETLQTLNCGDGLQRRVQFRVPRERPGVYRGTARLSMELSQAKRPFSLVRLGTEAPVDVQEGEQRGMRIWTISNGASEFLVCPDFGPSVVAWNRYGENQLWSAFPEPIGLAWTYPVFGGIHARMFPIGSHLWYGVLHRESFDVARIANEDARGIVWQGVRLSARPHKEQLKDMFVELDFVTVGESDVLKFVFRVRNLRGTHQQVSIGSTVAGSLGTGPTDLVLHGEGVQHRPKPWGMEIEGQRWGALTNECSGRTLLMVSPRPDVALDNAGQHGRMLQSGCDLRLPGGQTRERVYYLVLAESLDEAKRYRLLKDY